MVFSLKSAVLYSNKIVKPFTKKIKKYKKRAKTMKKYVLF